MELKLGFSQALLNNCCAALVCCIWLITILHAQGDAIAPQTCNPHTSKSCQTVVGYMPPANFNLTHLASLFSLNFTSLLGPNDIDPSLPNLSQLVLPPLPKPYLVPQTCGCLTDTRVVTSITYTVVSGDTLSAIATQYLNLVTYMEIANVSSISDPNLIEIGQKLLIPIPCSCLDNQSNELSLSYQIQKGDSLSKIAQLYNTSTAQLQDLNAQPNTTELEVGQVLFVPLPVCKANFSSGAVDGNLTVMEGTYELTANGCVQCSCNNGTLHCIPAPSSLGSTCSNLTCSKSSLVLGASNTSLQASGECSIESCVYKGFTTQSGILASLEVAKERSCPVAPAPETFYKPPPDLVVAPVGSPPMTPTSSPPTSSTSPPPTSSQSSPSLPLTSPPDSAAPLLVATSLSAWWWCLLLPLL